MLYYYYCHNTFHYSTAFIWSLSATSERQNIVLNWEKEKKNL